MPVTHWRDVQPLLALQVALSEELLHHPVHPGPVQVQRLGGVAQVRAVHHVLEDLRNHSGETMVLQFIHQSKNSKVKTGLGGVAQVRAVPHVLEEPQNNK